MAAFEDLVDGMPVQARLPIRVDFLQPIHLLIDALKFSGDVLIVGEKMPHAVLQIRIDRQSLGNPIGGLIFFLSQQIQVTRNKFAVNVQYKFNQLLRQP